MSGFLDGINANYNGLRPGYEKAYTPGNPVQGKNEEDQGQKGNSIGKDPGEECQTCKNRKYQDGSDENVSFKAAAHISPEAAAGRVRAHEGEHVANAFTKAAQKDGEVVSVSVRISTSVCPECGKTYVSGGTTSTKIRYPANPYESDQKARRENAVRGRNFDYAAKPEGNTSAKRRGENVSAAKAGKNSPAAGPGKNSFAAKPIEKGYSVRPKEKIEMERY